MTDISPHSPVVCLHSSGASGRQWRRLIADATAQGLSGPWHAPDFMGHAGRAGWPDGAPGDLRTEALAVLAALDLPPDQPLHLVGHSYGGATALQLALLQPQRVRSLTLYEPVAFGVLGEGEPGLHEARQVAQTVEADLDRGDLDAAARGFVGYWQGRDIWPELDAAQRARLAEPMPTIRRHFEGLYAARWRDDELARLQMPVQLICGGATRDSARAVAQTLARRLPGAQLRWLEGCAHLAPLSEPERVNPLILAHLRAVQTLSSAR
jgi:pimeloyl-ACP methyl ester carboxylesterase